MNMATKRILSLALAVCLLLGMTLTLPGPVMVSAAVGIQEGKPNITVNATVVGFGGHEWWVIGDASSGVQPAENAITLLAKNDDFGAVQFDDTTNRDPATSAYEGSLLHLKMQEIYKDSDIFLARERTLIKTVTLDRIWDGQGGSPYDNGTLSDQYVWPLSDTEADQSARPITVSSGQWWLRAPFNKNMACIGRDSGGLFGYASVPFSMAVRPAFQLNLASVLFTSDASGKPNSLATASLSAAEPPIGVIKFTMQDENQTLDVTATAQQETQTGAELEFGYHNATTGARQWVSCFLENDIAIGKDYYGKLVNASNGSAENGNLRIPLSGVDDGDYTLHIFSEQDNGSNYTDFASDPVTMKVTINGGNGTVSEFKGDVLSDDAELLKVAGESITITDGDGSGGDPYTAAITLDNSVASVGDSDLEAAAGATAELVDSTFIIPQSTVTLAEGDNPLYVKVTAEDKETVRYYHITATRGSAPACYDIIITPSPQEGGSPTATPTNAAKDETVTLEAKPASGYTFDRWESSDVSIATPTQLTATFTMPDNDVAITAYYKQNENPPTSDAPSITTTSLPDGKVGETYSETLTATGDTPITWTLQGGGLPLGFSLSDGGIIHGTPKAAGTADFTVKAENAHGDDTQALRIVVASGHEPGTDPTDPGTDPGTEPGTNPGTDPGTEPGTDPGTDPGTEPGTDPTEESSRRSNRGGASGGRSSSRGSSSSGGGSSTAAVKTAIPASASSWDGRTLTIDFDGASPLGITRILWDDVETEAYNAYKGSVIIRFDRDFIDSQKPGEHTVRVEFLNHTAETTVTVDGTGTGGTGADDTGAGSEAVAPDNNTYNPSTGGYPTGTANPNTGGGSSIWPALLLGSLGGAALVWYRRLKMIK